MSFPFKPETPAYDIERIKSKDEDGTEDNASYTQIKADDTALPEFARGSGPLCPKNA
ncbi:MAG: hypothetical protein H0A75_07000 [Candidatus Methanofishera endochildressiae]|uniref:Uncharacterized protein n=1 Tax=Candidatus Methanofishera endochildressiae TaxID=2738884 RepID=A0A7Z0SFF7_9GAMM|nr:hypothetical protein [Candidatus Methanofishera endochildressiae]